MAALSILFGFLLYNAQSNQYIKAIISPYSHLTDGYTALHSLMYQTTQWLCDEQLE